MKVEQTRGKKTVWTADREEKLRTLWADPETTAVSIAEAMGIRVHQAKHRARKLGLPKHPKPLVYPIVSRTDGVLGLRIPGAGGGHIVLIDDDKFEWFKEHRWFAHREGRAVYVIRSDDKKLHRLIAGAVSGEIVDHKDRSGLNNCRANLRIASASENCFNSGPMVSSKSQYKGVWRHVTGLFGGAVTDPSGRRRSIGYYRTEYDAARAHDALARIFRGDFAFQNLPEDPMSDEEIARAPALARNRQRAYLAVRPRDIRVPA